jgi:hypothetical protein
MPERDVPCQRGRASAEVRPIVDFIENGSNPKREAAWRELVDGVQALYPEPLPPTEAEAAAHNLVTFFRVLMDIDREQRLKDKQRQIDDKASKQYR